MKFRRTTKVLSDLGMSSMTDLVFLLLIFFLITSTLVNPNALKLLLPKSTGQVAARATVSVSIKHYPDQGRVTYHINGNARPVRFDQVEPEVCNLLDGQDEPTFSIYADETVPVKEVVALMNIAKRHNYKVIMATSPE